MLMAIEGNMISLARARQRQHLVAVKVHRKAIALGARSTEEDNIED